MTSVSPGTVRNESMPLSDGQYKQLIQFLQQSMSTTVSPKPYSNMQTSFSILLWFSSLEIAINFAGTSIHFTNNVYHDHSYYSNNWIVDTGATDHITPFSHILHNVTSFHSILHLPNGSTTSVTQMGSVMLSSDIVLQNVLCVPSFAYNLLSVSKLLKDAKCIATFAPTHCSIQAPSWKTSLKIGK